MHIGPSSSTASYIVPSEPNVRLVSLITTGDPLPLNGVFGGIPDGLGALDNGDGTVTILVNHEYGPTAGLVRDHGSVGAYIDRIVIDKTTLAVVSSDDLIKTVQLWNDATDSYFLGTTAFNRFCSADLPATSALFNAATGLGSTAAIFLTGEEAGNEGRAFATIVTGAAAGTAFELPFMGNLSYENVVANPFAQDKTVVAITDDQGGGQVYIYVGQKQATGSEIAKAGLTGGELYGIKVNGVPNEANGIAANGSFSLQRIGDSVAGGISNMTGAQIQSESVGDLVTGFLRPEDLAWDPDNPAVAYFVTTNSFSANPATTPTRLYKIEFADITNPQLGGTITAVIDGTEGYDAHMFDNISVADGKVILQEDPGNQSYLAKIWEYDIASDTLSQLANFDPAYFTPGLPGFITADEESSGVIDVTTMFGDSDTRAYLIDAQVHANTNDPATVQKGQLALMYVDDPFLIGGNKNDRLFGSGANETLRGNNGNDSANAGSGNDALYGGNGNDALDGGAGSDRLFGDNGEDKLIGGAGNDQLSGGNGSDYFIFDNRAETGFDTILDFSGGDRVLTTVQLADANNDGIIPFGADGELDLFGTSELDISNKGRDVDALAYKGTVVVDGTTYYSYGLGGGSANKAFAADFAPQAHFAHVALGGQAHDYFM
ncbi:MAG: DUF839 domain-containing protein [Sphingomonas sp.]|nr:DUF839 domain-containing protein [Sphingomonas sp.]